MRVKKLIKRFHAHCREHRSPNTVRSYVSRLRPLKKRLGDRRIESLDPDDRDLARNQDLI